MFDGGRKNRPRQASAEDLDALVAQSREERAALSTMLAQMQAQATRLSASRRAVQEAEDRAAGTCAHLEAATKRLDDAGVLAAAGADAFAERLAAIEAGLRDLGRRMDALSRGLEEVQARRAAEPPQPWTVAPAFDLNPSAVRATVDYLTRRLSALTARQSKSLS